MTEAECLKKGKLRESRQKCRRGNTTAKRGFIRSNKHKQNNKNMDTTKLLADAQQVVTDIQALIPTPTADPIATITVTTQSGATQVFVPQS